MRKLLLLLLLTTVAITETYAQKDNVPIGGRSAGMGHASVTLNDFWSVHNNQAGMAQYQNIAAGVYYENRFMVKELALKSFAVVLPIKKSGVIGVNVSTLGSSLYNETKAGLGYALSFGPKISAGVQLDYIHTHIGEEYGSKGAVTFEAGLYAKVTKNLTLGAHFFNPIRAKLATYNDERIPAIFRAGLSYSFTDKALITVEAEKDINFKTILKAGAEYHVVKPFYVRAGIMTNPVVNTFGIGTEFYKFKLDIAASRHPVLGFSPQVSLIYDFK